MSYEPVFNKKAIVRVEAKNFNPHASKDEKEISFKRMFTLFKKEVNIAKVLSSHREHQAHESKSRKKRRKQHEAELARLKDKWRENFFDMR